MIWNPQVSGNIDPHDVPFSTGPIEPAGTPFAGSSGGGFNPSDSPTGDPHDTPMSMSDGLGGGMLTGPVPSNIHGGQLDAGRTLNVSGDTP